MGEKTIIVCSSCGRKFITTKAIKGKKFYCKKCVALKKSEQGPSPKKVPKSQPLTPEKPIDLSKKKSLEEKTVASRESMSSEQTTITLGKTIAATKKIKEILNVEPSVDLEHTSQIYFSSKGRKVADLSETSVRDSILHAGEETKYIFDKEIGRGGMGVVVGIVDQDIRRKVAMKVLHPSERPDTSQIKRFVEEAQVTGQLEHPNIVPVHEIGIDEESNIYFTMKLVQGENLDHIISKIAEGDQGYQKKYSLGTLIQIFMKVCDGLGYAHSKGVLHRDLKPENVMIGDFGEVLLMDWGIAKILGQEDESATESSIPMGKPPEKTDETDKINKIDAELHTVEGSVMGTPSYLPPEQAKGTISELDERSDVFSLGGILYKILTHKAPYGGENIYQKLWKAGEYKLVPPDLRAPDNQIPPELNAICMKAMAREKAARYENAFALKQDLQLYLDGKSVSAKKDSLFVRAKKWVIRNKVASIGIAAAAACLVVGIVATAAYHQKKTQEKIETLISQGQDAAAEGRFEHAEEVFFAVLGLDSDNIPARNGIANVSGKALALKNKRLAKEKIKEAKTLFESEDYVNAYDAYVATFALDPESAEAIQGIKISAVRAEKQKAQERIAPILAETKILSGRKKKIDKSIVVLNAKREKLKRNIKGYEGFDAKKPFWDAKRSLLAAKIGNLKLESEIISKYLTVLSHDGENKEARKALSQIYYDKFTEGEARQDKKEMAYYKALVLTFDDGHYQQLLEKDGTLTLTSTPQADGYHLYRFVEGPARRMLPAPFSPKEFFSARKNSVKENLMQGIDPDFNLSKAAFSPIQKLLTFKNFNLFKKIGNLQIPSGSYLLIIKKRGYIDTRVPVFINRGEDEVITGVKLFKENDVPPGFVYIPGGKFIMGGDPSAPYSVERTEKFVPGFFISRNEVTAGDYLKFINYIETHMPDSAEKYLPRRAATSGFYWKKIGGRYQTAFPSDWPVLGISWNDARAYCKYMSNQYKGKGWRFRLPEDWEWEKAARGVDGRYFSWGNAFDYRFCSMANSKKGKREGPDSVGSFPLDESVYGVRDIAGNVSEWCQTFYDQEKNIRINRGSAWSYVDENYARCAGRNGHSPSDVADSRGFRMAVSIP